jgi:hypothetical protein
VVIAKLTRKDYIVCRAAGAERVFMKKLLSLAVICLLLAGCSVKGPVLYPNAKLQKVG